jgi:serine/threonine protein kinase
MSKKKQINKNPAIKKFSVSKKKIGNYNYYSKIIGKGSFCKVYKGTNINTNEIVAIKTVDLSLLTNKGKEYKDMILKRFINETKIIEGLNHVNIIKYIETIVDPSKRTKIYIIMEYCNEGDLCDYMKNNPGRNEKDINMLIKQLISGLDYLYSKGIVHRDIKPQNILLNNNVIKIIDFGFAKEWRDQNEMFNTLCGTPLYIAPEIIFDKKYNIKADLWSVGVVVFELMTNKYPFLKNNNRPTDIFLLLKLIKKVNIKDIILKDYDHFSEDCKNFLYGLLEMDVEKRLSWNDVIKHKWLTHDIMQSTILKSHGSLLIAEVVKESVDSSEIEKQINKNSLLGIQIYDDYIKIPDLKNSFDDDDDELSKNEYFIVPTKSEPMPINNNKKLYKIYGCISSSVEYIKHSISNLSPPYYSRSA